MQILTGTEFSFDKKTAVAIGKFDGVHLGHQCLIHKLLRYKSEDVQVAIFTFDPPPAVFFGVSDRKMLDTKEEKRSTFEALGIDVLIEFPMNEVTAQIEPADFIKDILIKQMKVTYIVAGVDIHFGKGGKGNLDLIKNMSELLEYQVESIEKVMIDKKEVSSSRIRSCLEKGEMEEVERLLGKAYSFVGEVVYGNQKGRELGFPTANIKVEDEKKMPPMGVYFAKVLIDGKYYDGISNLGYKPTIQGEKKIGLETYIYEYDQMIYGKKIIVELVKFLRAEKKFDSLKSLKKQVLDDIATGDKSRKIIREKKK